MTWLGGELLSFDLETTGVDPATALPVSFAFAWVENGALQKVRTGLINPGVPIPEGATGVHGITDEMVSERGGPLDRSIAGIVGILLDASCSGVPLTGTNLRYDLTVVGQCSLRLGGVGLRDAGWEGIVLDALVLDRGLDRFRKGGRKLVDLAALYGVPFDNGHAAASDAIAAVQVVAAIAKRYPEILEMDLDELHGRQRAWHYEWTQHYSEWRQENGEDPLAPSEGDWPLLGDAWKDGTPLPGDSLITPHQAADLSRLLQEHHDITDRQDRLDIVSGIIGRTISTTKELKVSEWQLACKDIIAFVDIEGAIDVLLDDAQDKRGGRRPTLVGEPPERRPGPRVPASRSGGSEGTTGITGDRERWAEEGFGPELDIGNAGKDTIASTMRLVMKMSGPEVNEHLRAFGLPRTGKVNDRRLRFYAFCCRERAAGNAAVEEIWTEASAAKS